MSCNKTYSRPRHGVLCREPTYTEAMSHATKKRKASAEDEKSKAVLDLDGFVQGFKEEIILREKEKRKADKDRIARVATMIVRRTAGENDKEQVYEFEDGKSEGHTWDDYTDAIHMLSNEYGLVVRQDTQYGKRIIRVAFNPEV